MAAVLCNEAHISAFWEHSSVPKHNFISQVYSLPSQTPAKREDFG